MSKGRLFSDKFFGKRGCMVRKTLEELNLIDNFLFGLMMNNPEVNEAFTRKIVKVILGKQIERIRVVPQKVFYGTDTAYHGARLDVYIEEENKGQEEGSDIVEESIFDIEPEKKNDKVIVEALPKRVRFYHAKIDAEALKTGEDYGMLKKVYVIFIMPFDPFGLNRMIYTIKNSCIEEPEMPYDDGATTIFLYTKGRVGVPSGELEAFLKFFEKTREENVVNEDLREIENMVNHVKKDRKAGIDYMKYYEEQAMIRRMGISRGLEIGRVEVVVSQIMKKLRKGYSPEQISEALEEDLENVQEICEVAQKYAPDYNEAEICREILGNEEEDEDDYF